MKYKATMCKSCRGEGDYEFDHEYEDDEGNCYYSTSWKTCPDCDDGIVYLRVKEDEDDQES